MLVVEGLSLGWKVPPMECLPNMIGEGAECLMEFGMRTR
jgi:hypothetical protein